MKEIVFFELLRTKAFTLAHKYHRKKCMDSFIQSTRLFIEVAHIFQDGQKKHPSHTKLSTSVNNLGYLKFERNFPVSF